MNTNKRLKNPAIILLIFIFLLLSIFNNNYELNSGKHFDYRNFEENDSNSRYINYESSLEKDDFIVLIFLSTEKSSPIHTIHQNVYLNIFAKSIPPVFKYCIFSKATFS